MNNKKKYDSLRKQYEKKSKDFDKQLLNIPAKENNEKFVNLLKKFRRTGVDIVFEEAAPYSRKTVAEKLLSVSKYFNQKNKTLKVLSTYRTLSEQKKGFVSRYKEFKSKYPNKSKSQLLVLANTFTAGIPILASHTAGAGIDVVLLDANMNELDFGSSYPRGVIESITDYPNLSDTAKQNRKLLKEGMEKFGFVNYPFEYWHYSIGDVCAAYLKGQKSAVYGPVEFDIKTNKIKFIDDHKHTSYFEIN